MVVIMVGWFSEVFPIIIKIKSILKIIKQKS